MNNMQVLCPPLRAVRLYGELGVRFGRVHLMAVETTAEAVRALSMLLDGFEAYMMNAKDRGVGFAVFIGKRNITQDELTFLANDDIRIAPVIMGAKNSGLFSIILGVALIAVSFLLPGGSLLAAGLFNAGLAMALGGVVQLLSPQPKDPKSKDKVENEPSYAFNGPVNTEAQGNCVPVAYGRPWTGSAVVSAGIDTGVYIPQDIDDTGVAQSILDAMTLCYPFDGDAEAYDNTGTAIVTGGWVNRFGGGVGAFSDSTPLGQAIIFAHVAGASPPEAVVGTPWDFTVVIDSSGMLDGDDILISRGNNGSGVGGGHFFWIRILRASGSFSAVIGIYDSSIGTFQTSVIPTLVAGGKHLLTFSFNGARTISFKWDGPITIGSVSSTVDMPATAAVMLFAEYIASEGGAAAPFQLLTMTHDEWFLFNGTNLSNAQLEYMYHLGHFRSLSQVIADASAHPELVGGDDGWTEE